MAPRSSTHLHKDLLKILVKATPPLRKAILKQADKKLVNSICEICDNTLLGNIPLTTSQKGKVKKHKHIIRKLAQRGQGWKKKRESLTQHGGAFLPILLSVLSSVLPAIFNRT